MNSLFLDICENVHLHYRDLRLEFTLEEFFDWSSKIAEIRTLLLKWRDEHPDWKESNNPEAFDNQYVIWMPGFGCEDVMLKESKYWPNRVSIEKVGAIYHIHYRDIRIELSKQAFVEFINGCKHVEV